MEEFETFPSKTWRVEVGCGALFVTIVRHEGQIIKVILHRKSAFECDLTWFEASNRQTSFQTNREAEQAVDDLKGWGDDAPLHMRHFCRKYNAKVKGIIKKGGLGGYSCTDALAKVLERELDSD